MLLECNSNPQPRNQTLPQGIRFALDINDSYIENWLDSVNYTGAKILQEFFA